VNFTLNDSGAFQNNFEFGDLFISGNSDIGFRPVELLFHDGKFSPNMSF
jgi:hypothetical protein